MLSNYNIDYHIKIGGSLFKDEKMFNELLRYLLKLSKSKRIILSTGSGRFPNVIIDLFEKTFNANEHANYEVTILLRDCVSIYLSYQHDRFHVIETFQELDKLFDLKKIPIISNSKMQKALNFFRDDKYLSTDSIACLWSNLLKAKKFIILTDVYGIYKDFNTPNAALIDKIKTIDLRKYNKSCVDRHIAHVLDFFRSDCYVLNGHDINNLHLFFIGKKFRGTHITI